MAVIAEHAKHVRNKELYSALMQGESENVIKLCQQFSEGALHELTIHGDTVLHMATYFKQKDLVLRLLEELPEDCFDKLLHTNDIGNTILHEAATSNRLVPTAKKMLRKRPELLTKRNRHGETALFRTARYGKMDMFSFLDDEINRIAKSKADYREIHQRDDKTTILHISVLAEQFELANMIARNYPYLIGENDEDRMTALQLLACNPSAFPSGNKHGYLMRLIYSCVSTDKKTEEEEGKEALANICSRVPLWESIRAQKKRYESVLELADVLVSEDTSWEASESAIGSSKPKTHKYGGPFKSMGSKSQGQEKGQAAHKSNEIRQVDIAETPLFLAAKSGCTEIVEKILRRYPQAVEHVDDDGRNILHVAVKYRQIHIFDIVSRMEFPMMRLIRKIDNHGNSILHMVGLKIEYHGAEDIKSPALLLQEDLIWFERVKKITPNHLIKHINYYKQTAEKLFKDTRAGLHNEAKEWLKRTAENCSIVAVLIATVAFAAAYTIPGGPNQNTGYPILLNQPFFVIFTITDVLSLTFALTSVITFLSILTSSYRLKDFQQALPQRLMLGLTLLILSVSMMMLAFAATIILMIRNKEQWTKIALYSVAFLPVTIFALSYLPLYSSLMKTLEYSIKQMRAVFPHCSIRFLSSWHKSRRKSQICRPSSTYNSPSMTTHYPV